MYRRHLLQENRLVRCQYTIKSGFEAKRLLERVDKLELLIRNVIHEQIK